jgi:hypothetical protein
VFQQETQNESIMIEKESLKQENDDLKANFERLNNQIKDL